VDRVQKQISAPVATIATAMNRAGSQNALGNLLADSQRWSAKADVAVTNNGGIRANLREGAATFGDLYEVEPFGNTLFRFTLTGAALRAYIEQLVAKPINVHVSGVTVRYDSSRPAGSRIVALTLASGAQVADDKRYTIAMNDFMATGGDGLALNSSAVRVEDLKTVDVDALAAYLRAQKQPVAAPGEPRIIDVATGAR
jgi:5'-nucleotidase